MTGPWATVAGVPVELRRSARRRTVALQVRPGAVTLYAPTGISAERLKTVLRERQEWIEHHLAQFAARPTSNLTFEDGSAVPYLGDTLTLRFRPGARVSREGDILWLPPGSSGDTAARVEVWTRRAVVAPYRALVEAEARTLGAAGRLGRVLVTSATGRWGSCSAAGDIRLHWKLSRVPREVLRYVAVHEAAHLLELNHSPRYWAHVRRVVPDYARWRAWLREFGGTL